MKKGLLFASLASVTAVTCGLAFAVANANKGIRYEATKAATKSIVFDGTHSLPSPAGVFDNYNTYQVSSYTGTGDPVNVRTEAMLPGSGGQTTYKVGGDHFICNYQEEGSSNARLVTTIGLNNITALTFEYGTTKSVYMNCSVYFYDKVGNDIGSGSYDFDASEVKTKTVVVDFEELKLTDEARKVEIWVYPTTAIESESYFVNSISASWEC